MCEKPLATRLEHCVDMHRALAANKTLRGETMLFSIGHVLRYSPHNMMLRRLLLEDRVIGDILSVVHTEPVGWWHFTHSYVRGNWRRESTSAPSLLTKSCHDIDLLLWILCSPVRHRKGDAPASPAHLPALVSSVGALEFFRMSRKPAAAGRASYCLSCPKDAACRYSAKRIYLGPDLVGLETGNRDWPVNVVVLEIESYQKPDEARAALLGGLAEDYDGEMADGQVGARNWFGRCVYESDNDVCDEQVVTMTWDEDLDTVRRSSTDWSPPVPGCADPGQGRGAKTATFHMVAQTSKQCERFSVWYGVEGEVHADSSSITIQDFATGKTTTHVPHREMAGHRDADWGLTQQFVRAVDMVKNHGWPTERAQNEIIACTLEEVIRSHAMVFCADEARREKKVVNWAEWWDEHVAGHV